MASQIIAIFIPLSAVIGGIFMIIFIRRYEYLEKNKMIEKGMDPSSLMKSKRSSGWGAVRFAFTAIGIGIGIILAGWLDASSYMNDDIAYPAMILVMGGIGLLTGTHYAKTQERKEKEQK